MPRPTRVDRVPIKELVEVPDLHLVPRDRVDEAHGEHDERADGEADEEHVDRHVQDARRGEDNEDGEGDAAGKGQRRRGIRATKDSPEQREIPPKRHLRVLPRELRELVVVHATALPLLLVRAPEGRALEQHAAHEGADVGDVGEEVWVVCQR